MQEKALMFLPEDPQGNATCRSIKAKAGSWTNIIIEMLKSENERQNKTITAHQQEPQKKAKSSL